MKLLIDIPEHIYEHAKEMSEDSRDEGKAMRAIANGTPQQRTGRWIKQNYGWNWQCSECGFVTPPSAKEIFTFCPNCGCKMEVGLDAAD